MCRPLVPSNAKRTLANAAALAFLCTVLAGCSNKTTANESNFGHAIDKYLAQNGNLCITFPELQSNSWPINLPVDYSKKKPYTIGGSLFAEMNALVNQGIVSSITTKVPGSWLSHRMRKVYQYTPTTKGRKFLFTHAGSSPSQNGKLDAVLCFGQMALSKVVNWKGPIKNRGYETASVQYTYQIKHLAKWAKSDVVMEAFPYVKNSINGIDKKIGTMTLVLTHNGWVVKSSG